MAFSNRQHPYENLEGIERYLFNDNNQTRKSNNISPLVIENTKNTHKLKTFMSRHQDTILNEIHNYGSVLFRGFQIEDALDFENIILSNHHFSGIKNYFMPEAGRVHSEHLKYIFHTNKYFKTGGGFGFQRFHNENFHSTDVPRYIAFCCFQPPSLGGETGLIHISRLYEQLDHSFKDKLKEHTFLADSWSIEAIMKEYKLAKEVVVRICQDFGLEIDGSIVSMYKPGVYRNTSLNQETLALSLSAISNLSNLIFRLFFEDYQGSAWFFHRALWRAKVFRDQNLIDLSWQFLPNIFHAFMTGKWERTRTYVPITMNEIANDQNLNELAELVRYNYYAHVWQANDLLIIDNTQYSHSGMPGFGKRIIRSILLNPLKLDYRKNAPGIQNITESGSSTLGDILTETSGSPPR